MEDEERVLALEELWVANPASFRDWEKELLEEVSRMVFKTERKLPYPYAVRVVQTLERRQPPKQKRKVSKKKVTIDAS